MTVTYHPALVQGSDEWRAARCGLLTASEMKLLFTPSTRKVASNDKERAHQYELLSQRITKYVEPAYVSDDMLRGWADEIEARALYAEHCAPVTEVGFITNDRWGFVLGYSPDGLVGDSGVIECKSRRQKYQLQTLIEHVADQTIPDDHLIQVQTGLLVSEREWCDYVTFCGGMHMAVIRVFPDEKLQAAIVGAAYTFERKLEAKLKQYQDIIGRGWSARLLPTERREAGEIVL